MNMPGFTAEASIYRERYYREIQVDRVTDALEVVAATRITHIGWGRVKFDLPFHTCVCREDGDWCACWSKKTIVA